MLGEGGTKRERLDKLLVDRGLVASRERARRLIMAGEVWVAGRRVDKPGALVEADAGIEVRGADIPFVSRGGLKLDAALTHWNIDVRDRVAVDVGASTGGFTDCLLQRGARHVFAIDVGYGQFAWSLRQDPRVTLFERANIRDFDPALLSSAGLSGLSRSTVRQAPDEPSGWASPSSADEGSPPYQGGARSGLTRRGDSTSPFPLLGKEGVQWPTRSVHQRRSRRQGERQDYYEMGSETARAERVEARRPVHRQPALAEVAVIDVSFISLRLVLPVVLKLVVPGAVVLPLVKPQFEVGKGEVGKGGVVRDPERQRAAVDAVREFGATLGLTCHGDCPSPILGPKGNQEFFLYCTVPEQRDTRRRT